MTAQDPSTEAEPAPVVPGPPPPTGAARWTREPLLWVALALGAGLAVIRAHHTRTGLSVIAAAVAAAGAVRLLLPPRHVGLLAVRARWLDAAILLGLAAGLVAMILLVPFPRR